MNVYILIFVTLLGLCMGSFVNALVWRLHKKRNFVSERSECTHCHHVLAWQDLLPVVSWLLLRGKCRYCHKPIEDSPLVELGLAAAFTISYLAWPFGYATEYGIVLFILWLGAMVLLGALFLYDLRWMLLLDKLTFPLIGLSATYAVIRYSGAMQLSWQQTITEMALGVLCIAGIYYLLYVISRGKWVGFGDVKLGIGMGLLLSWPQALLAVFLANLIGTLILLPQLITKKLSTRAKVPFGPFLIIGLFLALLWGDRVIAWYLSYEPF